jgi:hypothetical protein
VLCNQSEQARIQDFVKGGDRFMCNIQIVTIAVRVVHKELHAHCTLNVNKCRVTSILYQNKYKMYV